MYASVPCVPGAKRAGGRAERGGGGVSNTGCPMFIAVRCVSGSYRLTFCPASKFDWRETNPHPLGGPPVLPHFAVKGLPENHVGVVPFITVLHPKFLWYNYAPVDDGIHQHLDRVGVGQEVDDLERALHNAHLHKPPSPLFISLHERPNPLP